MLSSDLNFGKRGELECSRPRSARILAKIKNRQIYGKVFKNGPSEICRRQLLKICSDMACLNRSYHFKFFKGCLSQISLGPFLNTLSHLIRFLTQVFLLLLKMQLILIHHIGTFFTVCINCYFQTTDFAERCFCASLAPVTCLR